MNSQRRKTERAVPKMSTRFSLLTFSLLTFSLLILFSLSSSNPNPNPRTTAHTALTTYGFPTGLLPTAVTTYAVNLTTGEFAVTLAGDCKITLPPDNYLATYSRTVRGKIVKNRIDELDGIRVRAFFKWWSITGIRLSGDDLVFEVGMVSAKYPVKNFGVSPDCEGLRVSDS